MNRTATLICLYSGFAATILFFAGFVLLAGFLPPPAPTLSAADVAAFYQRHPLETLVGTFLIMTGLGLLAPWGAAIAALLRPVEGDMPVLGYIQLVNIAVATMVVILCPMFWAAAAYRSFDTPPEIIRVMNDIGWFLVLAPWPPFSFWLVALATAIMADKRPKPVFPRWIAWLSLWAAILFIPAGAVLIFKSGAFAWNGLVAFYIPVAVFFVWLVVTSAYAIRAIKPVDNVSQVP